jgi:hypothetical protein
MEILEDKEINQEKARDVLSLGSPTDPTIPWEIP